MDNVRGIFNVSFADLLHRCTCVMWLACVYVLYVVCVRTLIDVYESARARVSAGVEERVVSRMNVRVRRAGPTIRRT